MKNKLAGSEWKYIKFTSCLRSSSIFFLSNFFGSFVAVLRLLLLCFSFCFFFLSCLHSHGIQPCRIMHIKSAILLHCTVYFGFTLCEPPLLCVRLFIFCCLRNAKTKKHRQRNWENTIIFFLFWFVLVNFCTISNDLLSIIKKKLYNFSHGAACCCCCGGCYLWVNGLGCMLLCVCGFVCAWRPYREMRLVSWQIARSMDSILFVHANAYRRMAGTHKRARM